MSRYSFPMPESGQQNSDELYHSVLGLTEQQDITNMVSVCLRTDSDRSRPGIPAENDVYHEARFQQQSNSPMAFLPTNQGSSWDRLSSTSYSQSYSNLNMPQIEGIQGQDQSRHSSALLLPLVTYNPVRAASQSDSGGLSYMRSNPGQPVLDQPHAYLPSQSISPVSPGPKVFTPNSSTTTSSNPGFDSLEHMTSQELLNRGSPFETEFIGPEFGPEYREFLLGDVESHQFPGSTPFINSPQQFDNSFMNHMQSSQVNLTSPTHRQHGIPVSVVKASRGTKRKRLDPSSNPPRKDLSKINQVREQHACILCRKLHEEVGSLIIAFP